MGVSLEEIQQLFGHLPAASIAGVRAVADQIAALPIGPVNGRPARRVGSKQRVHFSAQSARHDGWHVAITKPNDWLATAKTTTTAPINRHNIAAFLLKSDGETLGAEVEAA